MRNFNMHFRALQSIIFLFCIIESLAMGALVDLDSMQQDFVLEMRQITIPGFGGAFNPSIIKWQGEILLSFRIRCSETQQTNQMGLIWLDDDFRPRGKPYVIQQRYKRPESQDKEQDPRLIILKDQLYIVYNNVVGPLEKEMRRMFVAKLEFDGQDFYIDKEEALLAFEGVAPEKMEKNWVPFVWDNQLLLAYSLQPHRILKPIFGQECCDSFAATQGDMAWKWGELRGGTPALIDEGGDLNGEYLAFFHSYKNIPTRQSGGIRMSHYFMGAYTFSSTPPFNITRISQTPIIGDKFYHGPMYQTWKPLRVVFPGGFLCDEQYIWLVYGRQDYEIWVARFDKAQLLQSLVPVTTEEQLQINP